MVALKHYAKRLFLPINWWRERTNMKKTLEGHSGSLSETISIFFFVSSQLTAVYLYQLHLQKLKFIKMAETVTDIILSNT